MFDIRESRVRGVTGRQRKRIKLMSSRQFVCWSALLLIGQVFRQAAAGIEKCVGHYGPGGELAEIQDPTLEWYCESCNCKDLLDRSYYQPLACSQTRKNKCLRVKNAKKGKKCAWRKIDGIKQCVLRASCSGISTEKRCIKKKKKRDCSWKKGTGDGSNDGSGDGVFGTSSVGFPPSQGSTAGSSGSNDRVRNLKRREGAKCVPNDKCPTGKDAAFYCDEQSCSGAGACLLCGFNRFRVCDRDPDHFTSAAHCESDIGIWCGN